MNPFLPISKLFTLFILPRRHLLSLLTSFLFPMYSPSQYLPLITAHYIQNFQRSRLPLHCGLTCKWTGVTFLLLGLDLWVLTSPWPWLLFLLAPLLSHLFPLQPRMLCNWSCAVDYPKSSWKLKVSSGKARNQTYIFIILSPVYSFMAKDLQSECVLKMVLWDNSKKLLKCLFLTFHFIFMHFL